MIVNLGPVQDFIASARRCQDLWFGSWLLSELSRATAEGIERAAGLGCIVFPSAFGNDKAAVANKILARVPAGVRPADLAQAGRCAMQRRLRRLAVQMFRRLPERGRTPYFHQSRALAHVLDLMEYQWVAVPLGEDYGAARQQAEKLLACRKNSRLWQPVPGPAGHGIPKSSLDGERESVLDERLYEAVARGRISVEDLRRKFFVKKGERLCGVGLLKRIGEDPETDLGELGARRPPFHSTAHLASAPLLVRLARAGDRGREGLLAYLAALRRLGLDLDRFLIRPGAQSWATRVDGPLAPPAEVGQVPRTWPSGVGRGVDGCLLFEGRLADAFETNAPPLEEGPALDRWRQARGHLTGFLRGVLGLRSPPTPYYALLLADGDHMGKAIDALRRADQHEALSGALADYALGCRAAVEEHGGSLVYAGGDDVLALLPLHTALRCARRLADDFARALRGPCASCSVQPTLSVGLAVVHHLDSLGHARAQARRAESLAKVTRNSLAIIVDKRSGADIAIAGPWDGRPPLDQRIEQWVRMLHEGALPHAAAFDLETSTAALRVPGAEGAGGDLGAVAAALGRRVLMRKRSVGAAQLDEGVRAALEACFAGGQDALSALQALSDEIQVARLFLRAHEDAWSPIDGAAPAPAENEEAA